MEAILFRATVVWPVWLAIPIAAALLALLDTDSARVLNVFNALLLTVSDALLPHQVFALSVIVQLSWILLQAHALLVALLVPPAKLLLSASAASMDILCKMLTTCLLVNVWLVILTVALAKIQPLTVSLAQLDHLLWALSVSLLKMLDSI